MSAILYLAMKITLSTVGPMFRFNKAVLGPQKNRLHGKTLTTFSPIFGLLLMILSSAPISPSRPAMAEPGGGKGGSVSNRHQTRQTDKTNWGGNVGGGQLHKGFQDPCYISLLIALVTIKPSLPFSTERRL